MIISIIAKGNVSTCALNTHIQIHIYIIHPSRNPFTKVYFKHIARKVESAHDGNRASSPEKEFVCSAKISYKHIEIKQMKFKFWNHLQMWNLVWNGDKLFSVLKYTLIAYSVLNERYLIMTIISFGIFTRAENIALRLSYKLDSRTLFEKCYIYIVVVVEDRIILLLQIFVTLLLSWFNVYYSFPSSFI